MADPRWWIEECGQIALFYKILFDRVENQYTGVFGATDSESGIRFKKFKTTDPIWQLNFFKCHRILLKIIIYRVVDSKSSFKFNKLFMPNGG